MFHDEEIAEEILNETVPSKMRTLGQAIEGFDEKQWKLNDFAIQVLIEGNLAKFTQNVHLQEELLKTGDTIMVEASPMDCFWGIGMSIDDPDATNMQQWHGTNYMGAVLMSIREIISQTDHVPLSSMNMAA